MIPQNRLKLNTATTKEGKYYVMDTIWEKMKLIM